MSVCVCVVVDVCECVYVCNCRVNISTVNCKLISSIYCKIHTAFNMRLWQPSAQYTCLT